MITLYIEYYIFNFCATYGRTINMWISSCKNKFKVNFITNSDLFLKPYRIIIGQSDIRFLILSKITAVQVIDLCLCVRVNDSEHISILHFYILYTHNS